METKKRHILVTNDDGIGAPGLIHIISALKEHFQVTVIAPYKEQSGKGASITLYEPLTVRQESNHLPIEAWSVTGTPADCIRIGLVAVMKKPPDLIVSGINRGSNHGRTVLYSGTIGGVIEGALRGIPGIAFSSFNYEEPEYRVFESYIPKIVDYVFTNPLPSGTLLNVNFPDICKRDDPSIFGIKMTPQGRQYWKEDLQTLPSYRGAGEYLLGSKISDCEDGEHSDSYWLRQGWITAVPIHVDELTDWRYIKSQKDAFDHLFDPLAITQAVHQHLPKESL